MTPPPARSLRTTSLLLVMFAGAAPLAAQDGPARVDYDGDARSDLALLDRGAMRVLRGEADGWRDVTAEVGLAELGSVASSRWTDVDHDGCSDLVVVRDGALVLLRSDRGTFEPLDARAVGLDGIEDALAAEWIDADGDGWSDLWVRRPGAWALLRNEAGRTFAPAASGSLAPDALAATPAGAESPRAPSGPAPAGPSRALPALPTPRSPGAARISGTSAGSPGPASTPPAGLPALTSAACARSLLDQATGGCVAASSAPQLGALSPLGPEFNISASGNVGVGALSTLHRLTVSAPNDDALRLIGAGAFGSQARLNFGDQDFVYLYEDVDDSLEIHSAGRTALTGGNVGIGTSAPAWPLHVVSPGQAVGRFDSGNSPNGSSIELRNNTANPTRLGELNFVNAAASIRGQIVCEPDDEIIVSTAGVKRLYVNGLGHVSVGAPAGTASAGPAFEATSINGGVAIVAHGSGTNSALTAESSFAGLGGAVLGVNHATAGIAVYGWDDATSGGNIGVYGRTSSASGTAVFSNGNFSATGTKSFVQPHPSDPSKEIRFVCLEGNESGTYFRGSARLAGGRAVIDVPEEFRLVSEAGGLTVQVTPRGPSHTWVESADLEHVVVRGESDVAFDYFVNGVRRGYADLDLVGENRAFVPGTRGVPFGTQYPDALRAILVGNGTLNADFTPNEGTAARLGWTLADPSQAAPEEER